MYSDITNRAWKLAGAATWPYTDQANAAHPSKQVNMQVVEAIQERHSATRADFHNIFTSPELRSEAPTYDRAEALKVDLWCETLIGNAWRIALSLCPEVEDRDARAALAGYLLIAMPLRSFAQHVSPTALTLLYIAEFVHKNVAMWPELIDKNAVVHIDNMNKYALAADQMSGPVNADAAPPLASAYHLLIDGAPLAIKSWKGLTKLDGRGRSKPAPLIDAEMSSEPLIKGF